MIPCNELPSCDLRISVPQPGEVLVRLTCTICGSDPHTYTGNSETTDLCVLGHEMVGVIETLGDLEMRDYHGIF